MVNYESPSRRKLGYRARGPTIAATTPHGIVGWRSIPSAHRAPSKRACKQGGADKLSFAGPPPRASPLRRARDRLG